MNKEYEKQYVFQERILFTWGSNKKEYDMVTKSGTVKRNVLMTACLMVFMVLISTAQASQQAQSVKKDVAASEITVNINTANAEQLTALPGVGAALADRIVKHRTEKGKFNTPSDLIAVKGVGQKKLDKMLKMIVVK